MVKNNFPNTNNSNEKAVNYLKNIDMSKLSYEQKEQYVVELIEGEVKEAPSKVENKNHLGMTCSPRNYAKAFYFK